MPKRRRHRATADAPWRHDGHAATSRTIPAVRLLSVAMLLLGAWLLMVPWITGYPFTEPAVDAHLNEAIVGVAVAVVGVAGMAKPRQVVKLRLASAVLGGWLAAAPFVLDYGAAERAQVARVNDVAVGVLIVILSAVSLTLARTARERAGSR